MFSNGRVVTRAADIEFSEEGYVRVNIRQGVTQTLDDAKENLEAICKSYKIPLIVDLTKAKPINPEIRRFYSGQVLNDHFSCMSIIIDITMVGRMMANIYLSVAKPEIPTKVFDDEKQAVEWTKKFCK
jgi:hypothetical protein